MLQYKLKNYKEINPWGNEGQLSLSWFALTDSYYWFDFSGLRFPQYSEAILKKFNQEQSLPYVDYHFARIFSDLYDILKYVTVPVPDCIHDYVDSAQRINEFELSLKTWLESAWDESDEQYDQIYEVARQWLSSRRLDFGYLVGAPDLYLIRNKDQIYFYWISDYIDQDGTPFWSNRCGEFHCSYDDFMAKLLKELKSFELDMRRQITQFAADKPSGVEVNVDQLHKNQVQYEDLVLTLETTTFSYADEPDWRNILDKIKLILRQVASA